MQLFVEAFHFFSVCGKVFLIVVLICKKDSVRSLAVKMFQLQRAALGH